MDFESKKKLLFEEGQFLSFIRETAGITLEELCGETNISFEKLLEFEDGYMKSVDEYNLVCEHYLKSLLKVSRKKGINIIKVIQKLAKTDLEIYQ
ncbi:hypothetical protein [Paenibacillus sp. NPDC058174]|uniref:hypothetical protein n=1 Tax=Paenibacillus sp. NPDC058174 TaxID=3346366 RepID=UPI0036DD18B9